MKLPHACLALATALLVVCALAVVPARAQVSGSIVGSVFDGGGTPLAGVKISARSDTQIGGAKVVYTGADGSFRIPGLLPGTFEIGATAPRFKQVLQKDVRVGITSPAEVTFVLDLQTAVEEIKVVETAPTVSTTAANVKEVFDLEYVEQLPIDGLQTKVEPFVRTNIPGGGGNDDRFRGGTTRQNLWMVEGFTMMYQRYTMKSLATIEAQTGAYGAENAAAQGGVINMVTKSGSNKFELDVSSFYEDNRLAPFAEGGDQVGIQTKTGINPAFSGPIIKDKLWFYLNLEGRWEYKNFGEDPAGLMPPIPREKMLVGRGSFKLTWQVTPRHKLSSFSMYNREHWWDRTDANFDREADTAYSSPKMNFFSGLTWEALLGDSVFFRSQVGYAGDDDQRLPQLCASNPDCFDIAPVEQTSPRTVRLSNFDQLLYNKNRNFEVVNTLEWFARSRRLGDHDLKLVSRYYTRNELTFTGVPGDQKIFLAGQAYDRRVEYFSNDPRLDPQERRGFAIKDATGTLLIHSLSDSMRATRYLSLNPGLAFTVASSGANAPGGELNLTALTPHLSLAWDATHDGRTALRASFAQHVDADAVRISRYALGDQVSRECRWDEPSQTFSRDCRFAGGASNVTFGMPCGPQGVDARGLPCVGKIKLPRMWEYTLGAEREVYPGVSLSGDLIYRLYTNPFELAETNRIWNGSGSELDPTGGYRNGRNAEVRDLETRDDAQRRYLGLTAVVRKRAGNLKIMMGYTWSKLEGNVDNADGDNNLLGDIPGRDVYLWGYLRDDRRHDVRGSATYQATRWLALGTTYSFSSGSPYSRVFRNQVTGRFEDYRAPVGINPGANVNDPGDDRELRLPDVQRLNLKLLVNFRPLFGVGVESFVDFLNVLNLRTTTAVVTEEGPSFGTVRTRANPMLLRVGLRYRL